MRSPSSLVREAILASNLRTNESYSKGLPLNFSMMTSGNLFLWSTRTSVSLFITALSEESLPPSTPEPSRWAFVSPTLWPIWGEACEFRYLTSCLNSGPPSTYVVWKSCWSQVWGKGERNSWLPAPLGGTLTESWGTKMGLSGFNLCIDVTGVDVLWTWSVCCKCGICSV